jgi:DNA repair protein RadA/Sms
MATARHAEHVCSECGAGTPRWMGRCPACGSWGTLVASSAGSAAAAALAAAAVPAPFGIAELLDTPAAAHLPTGLSELDRALGGGLVPGSVVLVGGEPGIGKSTLLLQAADRVARDVSVLYVTAEESLAQLARRARRLGAGASNLRAIAETDLERACAAAERTAPRLVVADSVQTLRDGALAAAAGSVVQVRRAAERFVELARRSGAAVLLVGHVTKDGALAGPKLLEHLVDAVLSFEGDDRGALRVLRCVKNRYGAVDEVGVFEMTGSGLVDARDVSAGLLACRVRGAAGSAIAAVREGRRTLLVEVQALTAPCAGGLPRRSVVGVDAARVALIGAVLERWGGVTLGASDVFVQLVGGLRVLDPALDLAVAVAIASAHAGRAVPADVAWLGEIGLCGDLRSVTGAAARAAEAARLGFARCVVPAAGSGGRSAASAAIEVVRAARVGDALAVAREA